MNAVSNAVYQVVVPNRLSSALDLTYTVKSNAGAPSPVIATHVGLDGLGVPEVKRRTNAYPTAEGGVDMGYQLQPRQLTWKMLIAATSEILYDAARDELQRVFMPLGHRPHVLKVTTAGGATRCLDVYVNGAVEMNQRDQEGYSCLVTVPLYAPYPIWYDPTPVTETITPAGSPTTKVITYTGTWHTWATITITGQIQDANVQVQAAWAGGTVYYNVPFTGHTIPSGQAYTINLAPNALTVVNGGGLNRAQYLSDFGGLARWRLFAAPIEAYNGQNTVRLLYTAVGAGAGVSLTYYRRYIGL